MSEQKIQELEEENHALRTIISRCRSVLSDLHYEWVYIKEKVGRETMRYYSDSGSESESGFESESESGFESESELDSNSDSLSFKVKVLNWLDEPSEFMDCLKKDCFELDSDCQVKSLECMVSISAWVSWNNQKITFHYYGDDSFSTFGAIELNGKKFAWLCHEYYVEIKSLMNSLNIPHNDDPNLIFRFHVLLAKLALFNNESEYDITAGNCYTFTSPFQPQMM